VNLTYECSSLRSTICGLEITGHIDEVTKGIIADVQADYSNGRIAIDAKKS